MEIEQSALWDEIMKVIASPSKPVHVGYFATLHGIQDVDVYKVVQIDRVRDFAGRYTDEVNIALAVPPGDFARYIMPVQETAEITVYKMPLTAVGGIDNLAQPMEGERYRISFPDISSPVLANRQGFQPTVETLNLTDVRIVSGQLIDKSLEQLRMKTVGGIFRNVRVEELLASMLTKESLDMNVSEERRVKGVDVMPASNGEIKPQIIIPHGTRLVDVPHYVHSKCGGVYSSGMGYYLHQDHWYVYPLYDTTRFNTTTRTLTIINVPPNKLPSIPNTYLLDGDSLVVVATGDRDFRDDSDQQQLNRGNGTIYADANKFMENFTIRDGNKAIATRGGTVNEYAGNTRGTGNNNLQLGVNPITANPFVEMSALARREGSLASYVWENSLPELIYPGMPTMVLYLDEDEVKQMFGTVLLAQDYVSLAAPGMANKRHITNTGLAVFVKREGAA